MSVALLVDGNSCYTPEKAISVGRLLEDNGICHFEEPCPYWELEWTKQVTDALKLDVTGGEQDCDLSTWKRIIEMRAVNVVQPDVCYLGGLTRTLKVAEMSRQASNPLHTSLSQPLPGHCFHSPLNGSFGKCRAVCRIFH